MMRQYMFSVTEQSQVGEARRQAVRLAQRADFDQTCVDNIALVATELATNLVKHATQGQLFIRVFSFEGGNGFEILSLDRGPGMVDVDQCMEDGYSTAGSPGTGLGAVLRTASEFDIYSQRGRGTVNVARILTGAPSGTTPTVGVIHQALHGEPINGDAWLVQEFDGGVLCVIADGLGHGILAANAAREIMNSIPQTLATQNAVNLIELGHVAARATVGASLGVAMLNPAAHQVRFAGVGNISAVVLQGDARNHLVSYNGVVGQSYQTVMEFTSPWCHDSVLVMHSDGISTRWDARRYPGLLLKDPSLIAAALYRDFARPNDDVTIVVLADQKPPKNLQGWPRMNGYVSS